MHAHTYTHFKTNIKHLYYYKMTVMRSFPDSDSTKRSKTLKIHSIKEV